MVLLLGTVPGCCQVCRSEDDVVSIAMSRRVSSSNIGAAGKDDGSRRSSKTPESKDGGSRRSSKTSEKDSPTASVSSSYSPKNLGPRHQHATLLPAVGENTCLPALDQASRNQELENKCDLNKEWPAKSSDPSSVTNKQPLAGVNNDKEVKPPPDAVRSTSEDSRGNTQVEAAATQPDTSTQQQDGDDLMPFRKMLRRPTLRNDTILLQDLPGIDENTKADISDLHRSQAPTEREDDAFTLQRRRSISVMEDFLDAVKCGNAGETAPTTKVVSLDNPPEIRSVVTRGPCWRFGDEDGGPGTYGTILDIDQEAGTVQVYWHETQILCDLYQYEVRCDLCYAPEGAQPVEPPRQRSKSKLRSGMESMIRRVSKGVSQEVETIDPPPALRRRNSQESFATPQQTIIILDWDDTLFPTTYVRDDLRLSWDRPLDKQRLSDSLKSEVRDRLLRCSSHAENLLRQATQYAHVVLVTLAKRPWVTQSCANFYQRVGKLIEQLNVPIVYAQEGAEVDYNKQAMASSEEVERQWSMIKGKAIAAQVQQFYSQYEGQSWKNIISVGDSNFERLGTFGAAEEYMKDHGLIGQSQHDVLVNNKGHIEDITDSEGHLFRVRTKSFRMIDQPTVEELTTQLKLMRRWLPQLVCMDDGCDFDLETLDDQRQIDAIEQTLKDVAVSKPGEEIQLGDRPRKGSKESTSSKEGSPKRSIPTGFKPKLKKPGSSKSPSKSRK